MNLCLERTHSINSPSGALTGIQVFHTLFLVAGLAKKLQDLQNLEATSPLDSQEKFESEPLPRRQLK